MNVKKLLLLLALAVGCWAQPAATNVSSQYFKGLGGSTTWYYWIVTYYPFGTSPVSAATNVGSAAATLTQADFVSVQWTPMPSATSYDVLRNTTGTTPTGACNCKVANVTGTSFVDYGATAQNYTVSATPGLISTGGLVVSGTSPITAVVSLRKYSLIAIANGVNGCANANGCWQVNGVLGANKTAGLTQNVTITALPANTVVNYWRMKTAVACAGTTTLTTDLGVTGATTTFYSADYDLKAAVDPTNAQANVSSFTSTAGTNVLAALTSTVENIDLITAGCALDIWLTWGTLP